MEFNRLETQSLKNLFIEQMEHLILSGELAVGEKLPSERQLAQNMQVSRGVVNSGLSELQKKGFIEVHPRSGTYVADYRIGGTLETLNSIMNYNGGTFRREEVKSILEVRIALDSLAVTLCAESLTDEQLNQMEDHVETIKTASNIDEAVFGAYSFQLDLAMFSGNMLVPLIFHSFKVPIFALWERFCVLYGINTLYQNNREFLNRLKTRDVDKTIEWIQKSISESIDGKYEIYYE